uniref:non-specific serine/threonine protein kinase n=1 Tax=Brugia timori TaxID=42155 RepID=A0A0R3Q4H8_9BILA
LAIWGSKGNKVIQLYNCLGRAKLVRAMKAVRHLVNPLFYCWEEQCLQSADENSQKSDKAIISRSRCSAKNGDITTPCYKETPSNLCGFTVLRCPTHFSTYADSHVIYKTLQNTPCIKYNDIVRITNNFSLENILGSGGYGTVYRGTWEKTVVAVKRIQAVKECGHEKEQIRQSLQELRMLSKYRHDNILPLYAYSLDGPQPCLLYQYMRNGSLFDCLFRKESVVLTWLQRLSIMIGCARALHYLHSVAKNPIIHGDVKSANILLDKHFEPKLGDFGLCRDNFSKDNWRDDDFVTASHVKGTLAYLPQEFLTERVISTKLDVYGYGVVSLEVSTGLKPHVMKRCPQNIVEYVMDHQKSGKNEKILADYQCNFTSVMHTDSSEQPASVCMEIRMTEDELRRVSSVAFCETCSRTFANKNAFRLHQVKTHNSICGEADSALFHRKRITLQAQKHYLCPVIGCRYNSGRFFNAYKLLHQHFFKVHEEKRFRMPFGSLCIMSYKLCIVFIDCSTHTSTLAGMKSCCPEIERNKVTNIVFINVNMLHASRAPSFREIHPKPTCMAS